MQSKKAWQKPQLIVHGSLESVTQTNSGFKKIKGIIAAGKSLNAILSI